MQTNNDTTKKETKEEKIERISRKLLGLLEESTKKDIDD